MLFARLAKRIVYTEYDALGRHYRFGNQRVLCAGYDHCCDGQLAEVVILLSDADPEPPRLLGILPGWTHDPTTNCYHLTPSALSRYQREQRQAGRLGRHPHPPKHRREYWQRENGLLLWHGQREGGRVHAASLPAFARCPHCHGINLLDVAPLRLSATARWIRYVDAIMAAEYGDRDAAAQGE